MPLFSIGEAFRAQGVPLKYPVRSRSGIRSDDGAVVIAIEECDVHVSADGFRCRLWGPGVDSSDWPTMKERLEHCRLAAQHGGADGLLIKAGLAVEPDVLLTLYVERRGSEYWASWGSTARGQHGAYHVSAEQYSSCAALAA